MNSVGRRPTSFEEPMSHLKLELSTMTSCHAGKWSRHNGNQYCTTDLQTDRPRFAIIHHHHLFQYPPLLFDHGGREAISARKSPYPSLDLYQPKWSGTTFYGLYGRLRNPDLVYVNGRRRRRNAPVGQNENFAKNAHFFVFFWKSLRGVDVDCLRLHYFY